MKKEAIGSFSTDVLHSAARLYNISHTTLKELAGFENFIYGGMINEKEVVLRLCHSTHRNMKQIEAELDWLLFLKNNGAAVCGPVFSNNNSLVEEVIATDQSSFFVSVFEKAKGKQIILEENRDNTALFYNWGKSTGQLHKITKQYTPSPSIKKRDDYMEMSSTVFATYLPDDGDVKQEVTMLFDEITSLLKTEETYLLTHTDLHSGNFFYDNDRLWIFDFDDCSYHYIIHDLAMPLYYSTWQFNETEDEKTIFANKFMTTYVAGYLSEQNLPLEELKKLPLFMRLRDCDLYAILHFEWADKQLNEKQKKLLLDMKERILSRKPVVDLDYEEVLRIAKQFEK
ncbi:phosphotransferase enzyme family protein [Evansella sp. AB-rgal1]|uniref:phosphotransferase enzyme family protein n=1 Tax=Evansella sp. AB-rgal1 TaxID=3242696 RepID=UPI00359E623A